MSRRSASYFVLHTKRRQHGLDDGFGRGSLAMREAEAIIYGIVPVEDEAPASQEMTAASGLLTTVGSTGSVDAANTPVPHCQHPAPSCSASQPEVDR